MDADAAAQRVFYAPLAAYWEKHKARFPAGYDALRAPARGRAVVASEGGEGITHSWN